MDKQKKNIEQVDDSQNIDEEIDCGIKAYNSLKYKKAYELLYKAYKSTKCTKKLKGKVCYYLALIFLYADDDIIEEIENDNKELANARKLKGKLEGKDARKELNRKYLNEGADLGYIDAMIEYGLNCVRLGMPNAFIFDSSDKNREVALAWANLLMKKDDKKAKLAGYIICAKYYLHQSTIIESDFNLNNYCYNTLEAYKLDSNDQRACYFMAMMAGDERIKKLEEYEEYYNTQESYDLFKKTRRIIEKEDYPDPIVQANVDKYIEMFQKYFPEKGD